MTSTAMETPDRVSSSATASRESARSATSSSSSFSLSTSSASVNPLILGGSCSGYPPGSVCLWEAIKEADTRHAVVHVLRATWITSKLCFSGFRDACSLHRTSFFFKRSRTILMKTGHCFLLNGCIFLGSIFLVDGVIIPAVRLLSHVHLRPELADGFSVSPGAHDDVSKNSHGVQGIIVGQSFPQLLQYLCNVFWFYPAYIISFVINCLWYNDIATHAFNVIQEEGVGGMEASSKEAVKSSSKKRRSRRRSIAGTSAATARLNAASTSGLESVFKAISEEIYRILMFAVFFIQVYAVRFLPFAGPVLNFILLSWLYAYYCFDYKWALLGWTLNRRLWFFETYWAYFLGFGSPCAVISSVFSSLVGSGVMSFLFPWFVLLATASDPEHAAVAAAGTPRLVAASVFRIPIFRVATGQTLALLRFLQSRRQSAKSN